MKEVYEQPEVELVRFSADIVTSSTAESEEIEA